MKLIELFDSRDKKKRLSHIRNLIATAVADGELDEDELKLIFGIALKSGLTPEEYKRIIIRPESVSFTPPDSYRERIEQLYDMVLVMMVDGEIHDREIKFCKTAALRLGFKSSIIDHIVRHTIDVIIEGIAAELAIQELMREVE